MYFINFSQKKHLQSQTLYPTVENQNSEVGNPTLHNRYPSNELDSGTLLFLFWTTIFSFTFLILIRLLKKIKTLKIRELPALSNPNITCRQCLFFTDNKYLKCAVRPDSVLTNKAIDCADYCAVNNQETVNKP